MTAPPVPGSMVLLTRLARVVFRRSTEAVLGMRLKQFVALNHLRDHEGLSQQALGDALCLDANNLVLLLNELEAGRLVERRRDPGDRRRHLVEITRAGRRALLRAERGMESIEDEVLGALGVEERAELRALLSRALEREGLPLALAEEEPASVPAGR
jgi:DNA-binding MarR family transcriptional regulator